VGKARAAGAGPSACEEEEKEEKEKRISVAVATTMSATECSKFFQNMFPFPGFMVTQCGLAAYQTLRASRISPTAPAL
jgi:hypothetical protein